MAKRFGKFFCWKKNFYINEEGRYFEINKTTTDFKFGGLSFDKKTGQKKSFDFCEILC